MSFCHQVPWSIQQWAQIFPSLLFTAMYPQKPFCSWALPDPAPHELGFPNLIFACLNHVCIFIFLPIHLSFLSTPHLASKFQLQLVSSLFIHASFLYCKDNVQQSISLHWLLGHLCLEVIISPALLCPAVSSSLLQILGWFSFSEIQHSSSKCYSLNYRLLVVRLWVLHTRSQTTLSLIDIWDHPERWCWPCSQPNM